MKLHLLFIDESPSCYGAEFYLLGAFKNREEAEVLQQIYNPRYTKIIDIDPDEVTEPQYVGGYFRVL